MIKLRGDFLEVTHGYCKCGCGQKTTIANKNHTKNGYIKGEPMKFIKGHRLGLSRDNHMFGLIGKDSPSYGIRGKNHPSWKGGRVIAKYKHTSYVLIYMPEHSKGTPKGYVFEHILVAEKMNGGPLPKGSVVHHKDAEGLNNSEDNLQIFKNNAEHAKFHAKQRRLDNG